MSDAQTLSSDMILLTTGSTVPEICDSTGTDQMHKFYHLKLLSTRTDMVRYISHITGICASDSTGTIVLVPQ